MHELFLLRRFLVKRLYVGWVAACALCLLPIVSHAQSVVGSGAVSPLPSTVAGNSIQFDRFLANVQNIGRTNVAVASDGTLVTQSVGRLPGGQAVTVGGKMAKASVVAALGRFAAKSLPLLSIGYGLFDLADELGFRLSNTSGTAPTVTRTDRSNCDGTYCTRYQTYIFGGSPEGSFSSFDAACSNAAGRMTGATSNNFSFVSSSVGSNICTMDVTPKAGGTTERNNYSSLVGTFTISDVPDYHASTVAELADAIAAKSGWPTSSALARATVDAIKSGETIEVVPDAITGPATSPGPVKTSTVADGTVTTSTTTNNHTYNDNRVTTTTTTVTNVYNPGTGLTTTEKTETAPQEEPQKDQCEQYPDSAGCSKLDVPDGEVPKKTVTVDFSPENLGLGSGSCPAPFTFDNKLGHFELVMDRYCDAMTDWVRPVFLAVAAFAAFFIAWPRGES